MENKKIRVISAKKYVKLIQCLGSKVNYLLIEFDKNTKFEGVYDRSKNIIYVSALDVEGYLNNQKIE